MAKRPNPNSRKADPRQKLPENSRNLRMEVWAVVAAIAGLLALAPLLGRSTPSQPPSAEGPAPPTPAVIVDDTADDLLSVHSTTPFVTGGSAQGLHVVFQITSTTDETYPVTAGYDLHALEPRILGWSGLSLGGTECTLARTGLKGVDQVQIGETGLPRLPEPGRSGHAARPVSDLILVADFSCDRPLAIGERLFLYVRLYVWQARRWRPAEFVFEYPAIGPVTENTDLSSADRR